ncbi:AsmA family protein [Epilithonimonas mollis]|uniref:DUF748 domain-containing protein n=1 Tax=Epilithonimonas mollis TaxID=216903 RepID=A0A1M6R5S2_9FLAO|nr:hypothetical protein [Epilithonimonas mollis]SHK27821.1 hypothetical protein SAMN05444371_1700 [Epilithonimonas mollis]
MKKTLKIPLIILGSFLALVLIINIGFSLWLKYKLPDYLKNKTPYQITYESLTVEILSGSISATQIKIKSKHPDNLESISLNGTLGALNISRLGIIEFLKNNRIEASSVKLSKPNLFIRLSKKNDKPGKEPIPFTIKNIEIDNGNFNIKQSDSSQLFSAKNLNLDVRNLSLNKNPDELPFALDSYTITAKDLFFQLGNVYALTASSIKTNNGKLDVADFEMKSLVDFKDWERNYRSQRSLFGIKSKNLTFEELVFNKTKLSLKNAQILNPEFIIRNRDNKVVKNNKNKSGFYIDFQNVDIINGKLSVMKADGKKSMSIASFNANVKSFLTDSETSKNKVPFTYQDYEISGHRFFYDAGKYYTIDLSSFDLTPQNTDLKNFKLNPKYSRTEFVRMIPMENDLFNISANRIQLSGLKWKYEEDQPDVLLKNVKLTQVDANIFRSKIPKDNPKEKLLYSRLLRNLKFPLLVENLHLINSKLVYEEDKPDSNGPGKILFTNFNMNVKNLNSNKKKGADTKVPILINCKFMDVSPMKVNWNFDTANLRDQFTIAGYINSLPADDINPFIKPYMNVTATGTINSLRFDFRGNNDIMNGQFRITHKDLKVSVLDKDTKEKKKLLSAVANLVVKKDSKKFPESVDIYVERSKDRSFFNFYWKGIEDGLKKSLLVIKI